MPDQPTTPDPDHLPRKAEPLPESTLAEGQADDAAWQAPWVATPEHPRGAGEVAPPPQTATGHYGPGYADPTRHYGNTVPGQARQEPPAQPNPTVAGQARTGPADTRSVPEPERRPAAPAPIASENVHQDLSAEEVGFRPPDHLPAEDAPASENAALIFERS